MEGVVVLVCSGVRVAGGSTGFCLDVREGIDVYHGSAHVVSLFEDLWLDVGQESI